MNLLSNSITQEYLLVPVGPPRTGTRVVLEKPSAIVTHPRGQNFGAKCCKPDELSGAGTTREVEE